MSLQRPPAAPAAESDRSDRPTRRPYVTPKVRSAPLYDRAALQCFQDPELGWVDSTS